MESKQAFMLRSSILLALAALGTLLAVSTIVVRNSKQQRQTNVPANNYTAIVSIPSSAAVGGVCQTDHCKSAAERILRSMNLTADPCSDFHQFSCGGFQSQSSLPPADRSKWDAFAQVEETIYLRGREIIEEEVNKGEEEWHAVRKAKVYYKSCMDEKRLDDLGVSPMKEKMSKLGGWPVVEGEDWNGTDYTWYDQVYAMSRQGFRGDFIVSLGVGEDNNDSTTRILTLSPPTLGLAREYLIKGAEDKDVKSYFEYMVKTAEMFGADRNRTEVEMKKVLLFELELAQAMTFYPVRATNGSTNHTTKTCHCHHKNKTHNCKSNSSRSSTHLISDYPSLPGHPQSWALYVERILSDVVKLDSDEKLVVESPPYMRNLSLILGRTPTRVVANYLGWRTAKSAMAYLDGPARALRHQFDGTVLGAGSAVSQRWKTCVQDVGFNSNSDSSFRIPLAAVYVRRHFPAEAKVDMLDMIGRIRGSFARNLDGGLLDWMDERTRGRAKEKLEEMLEFIAYPEELLDRSKVEELYGGVGEIREDDYLGNALRMSLWSRGLIFGRLKERVDRRNSWLDHSVVTVANAYYQIRMNAMVFPAGLLQGVFYDHLVPRYVNFGAIGSVIGHEMTHGFDDMGSKYDFQGNEKDWWEPKTRKEFFNKTKCIVDQYSRYYSAQVGLRLNGVNNLPENIADNGGVKESFMAYELWASSDASAGGAGGVAEPVLPGLESFTPRQLFWVSYSQVWCAKYRDAALKNLILTDRHAPSMFRIIGPLSNSEDFAKTFKCRKNSPMNPNKKCSVW